MAVLLSAMRCGAMQRHLGCGAASACSTPARAPRTMLSGRSWWADSCSGAFGIVPAVASQLGSIRGYYRFARPPGPNADKLRQIITERLTPVCFYLKNDLAYANWVYDMHFMGILCSPKFEGKTFKEINAMVNACAAEAGMEGRVRMICQPPSRWHMLRKRARKRWNLDM
mmetsp:Transcript_65577/g.125079  ORF Transcript_65577/g.125079 Transcript_65577/m.125079 type:complete len:170 (-) Transcript_65577:65-574(-)